MKKANAFFIVVGILIVLTLITAFFDSKLSLMFACTGIGVCIHEMFVCPHCEERGQK